MDLPVSVDAILGAATTLEFDGSPSHDVDLLLWLGGDFGDVHLRNLAERTIDLVRRQFSDWYVTLLVDGPDWEGFTPLLECGRRVCLPRSTNLPQALFSLGVRSSKFPWVSFLWSGSEPSAEIYRELRESASGADLIYAEGLLAIPAGTSHPVQHGRLKMFDAVPMECCLAATQAASRIGFDLSPIHQRSFWWDFTIRMTRHNRIASRVCSAHDGPRVSWKSYPFLNSSPIQEDTAARYTSHENDLSTFLNDINETESEKLAENLGKWHGQGGLRVPDVSRTAKLPKPWPIKILVLGGIFEPHHNELCFFTCFERLRGKGYLTWRSALYEYCTPEDLHQYDLVIFSRPRDPNCRALMDACAGRIPSIVMIDDNWMALGIDNERYRPVFGPGQPQMETFLDCVRRADVTLVYNPVLAEDVAPFARKVVELSPHVDARSYNDGGCNGTEVRPTLLAGFSGSQRPETGAFHALARFAENHSDVEVLFMGAPLPPELLAVDRNRVQWAPYQMNYPAYARKIARLRPDILLAPLDECRASASKAPNKFLEISVLCAAGIYSRVAPYTTYVQDERTGLLVGNGEQDWFEALERLYCDSQLRKSIAAAAHEHVLESYSVERVIPQLLHLFATVVS